MAVAPADVGTVDSIAQLRDVISPSTFKTILVSGYYAPRDGGGGQFTWSPTSAVADDGGFVIKPANISSDSPGRWLRTLDDSPVPPQFFGAKGDGVADDTAAVVACITKCNNVLFPSGIYLVDGNRAQLSGRSGFEINGVGVVQSVIRLRSNGAIFSLNDCQRFKIQGIAFQVGSATSGVGIHITGTGGVYTIAGNSFTSFPQEGLRIDHDAGGPGSGAFIQRNVFLSCAFNTTRAQLYAEHLNDSWIIENQFGTLGLNGPYAAYGCQLVSCSAGNYERNYHWENLDGCAMTGCNYIRIIGNRFETNQRRGLVLVNMTKFLMNSNTIHTNSMAASGTYPGVDMFSCTQFTYTGNTTFEWTGGTTLMSRALAMDNACNTAVLTGNTFYGYRFEPVQVGTGVDIFFSNNIPKQ
ncbi:right-handed parallel beta-helix repeat-containing protein [Inquilinus limosus]|uniref:right-handed parallel beta-helix repeat-containing protein n=1 Tax=Inquilinus limosus TaxID=171674 RepID=UPI003F17A0A2